MIPGGAPTGATSSRRRHDVHPVIVDVAVIVIVIAPVIVAALVSGNDTVLVIDIVDDHGSISLVNIATMRSSSSVPRT